MSENTLYSGAFITFTMTKGLLNNDVKDKKMAATVQESETGDHGKDYM